MRPVIFEIHLPWGWSLPLHGYGLMIVVGFLIAAWVATREGRRRGLPDCMYDLGLAMLLSGLIGGRIFYYLENYEEKYSHEPFVEFFKIWKGGLVFYGGAIAGLLGGVAYCKKKRLPVMDSFDAVAPAVPIAMAFGRLGCFLNGCCFGTLCAPGSPLGIRFPIDSPAAEAQRMLGVLPAGETAALPVHPVQLYQAAHDFVIAGLLLWILRRGDCPRGGGIPLLFTLYGVGRFFLEGLRADNLPTFTGLTISQNLSLALIVGFGAAFVALFALEKKRFRQA